MPNKRIIASYIMITLLLFGCNMNSETGLSEQGHHTQFTKISTDQSIDQHISNQVKEKLATNEDISHVKAVNSQKHIAIAFEVPHLKRFQLQKIKKQVKNDIKKQFPNMKVEVSTDQKIVLELERLEKKLQTQSLSDKKLKKELKRIIELMKEQT
ncbi:MAG TPA: YhcN/YlaJ family sporulation lipoprotein [Bacillota bacterium]|nr:YhcN/YlaJ family sporulation lipoprotein [Bacillota bacterium]